MSDDDFMRNLRRSEQNELLRSIDSKLMWITLILCFIAMLLMVIIGPP